MAIRPRKQRAEDAQKILTDYLPNTTEAEVDEALDISTGAMPSTALGKVTQVVTSDPTYGPHLVVQQQQFTGTPPTASDSLASTVRCYPTPNNAVTDYAVDDFVLMHILADSDAYVAVKLG